MSKKLSQKQRLQRNRTSATRTKKNHKRKIKESNKMSDNLVDLGQFQVPNQQPQMTPKQQAQQQLTQLTSGIEGHRRNYARAFIQLFMQACLKEFDKDDNFEAVTKKAKKFSEKVREESLKYEEFLVEEAPIDEVTLKLRDDLENKVKVLSQPTELNPQ